MDSLNVGSKDLRCADACMEPLVGVGKVADVLGVDKSWVYRRTRAGSIPVIRVGKYCRFRLSQVLAWLEQK
jgi:excisionase family DNA binding protein